MIIRLLPLLLSILLLSCQVSLPKDPYTLVWGRSGNPSIINPVIYTSNEDRLVINYIFETLLEADNLTLKLKPNLAKSWEVSKDKLQYTFTIRDDVKWQDGRPFSVDDVIYTIKRIRDPKVASGHRKSQLADIVKIEILNQNSVRFTYSQPLFSALHILSMIPIIPKHLFDNGEDFNSHSLNQNPIGTGPYKFKKWKKGSSILLERNENYWGRLPDIKKIHFKYITDGNVALQLLKKGELDRLSLGPLQWYRQTNTKVIRNHFEKHRYSALGDSFSFVGWNLRKTIFQDKRVRQAMAHLVDRQKIIDRLMYGLGEVMTGPFSPVGKNYDPTIELRRYNPEKAAALLKEAGWARKNSDGALEKEGLPFKFILLMPTGSRTMEKIANIMRENFNRVGIKMEVRPLEWGMLVKHVINRDFDAVSIGWTTTFPEDSYPLWHSSQMESGSNFVGFQNNYVDQLLEKARQEFDDIKRTEINKEIHSIIHEEQPYLFFFGQVNTMIVHRRFQNVIEYPSGVDVEEWKVAKQ